MRVFALMWSDGSGASCLKGIYSSRKNIERAISKWSVKDGFFTLEYVIDYGLYPKDLTKSESALMSIAHNPAMNPNFDVAREIAMKALKDDWNEIDE